MTIPDTNDPHPWLAFLNARLRVLRWLRAEGKTDTEIAAACSMDPGQVQAILLAVGGPAVTVAKAPRRLSDEALRARAPLPLEVLADALQDRVGSTGGRLLGAMPVGGGVGARGASVSARCIAAARSALVSTDSDWPGGEGREAYNEGVRAAVRAIEARVSPTGPERERLDEGKRE